MGGLRAASFLTAKTQTLGYSGGHNRGGWVYHLRRSQDSQLFESLVLGIRDQYLLLLSMFPAFLKGRGCQPTQPGSDNKSPNEALSNDHRPGQQSDFSGKPRVKQVSKGRLHTSGNLWGQTDTCFPHPQGLGQFPRGVMSMRRAIIEYVTLEHGDYGRCYVNKINHYGRCLITEEGH